MTTELAVQEGPPIPMVKPEANMLLDVDKFEHAYRVATMLSTSTMVPDHFKKNPGNCMIALNFSARAGLDPFMTMQKMYIIHGKPGIESQLAIALINKAGIFTPLEYQMKGEGDNASCIAWATRMVDGKIMEGPVVSIDLAKKEGWYSKKGSKWQTMPDLMLRYRAAMFFGRLYCPEALMGMMSNDELHDIKSPVSVAVDNDISLKDKLAAIETKPEEKPDQIEDKPNPLHDTGEYKEWTSVKEDFPEESKQMVDKNGEPANPDQCLQAIKMVKEIIDTNNAEG